TWLNPEIEKQNILQEIEQILPVRNQSILAHGWTPIKEKNIKNFEKVANSCLDLIFKTCKDKINRPEKILETLEFVKIPTTF
ncbi:MAG: hypothetical protein ACTSRG_25785, partial [Candidatus Helarchaeota archaeon]